MNKIKTVMIGLDGGTFDIINPMIKEGKLKNINKLIKGGAYGILNSTFPPITSPAWITMTTGKTPIELGIFGFRNFDKTSKKSNLVNASMIKEKRIWDIIAPEYDSCIVNVPMTYPPKEIKGDLITGMMTPSKSSEFTKPKNLKNKIPKDYVIECLLTEDPKKNIKLVYNMLNQRIKTFKYLIKNRPKSFMFFVIRGTDVLQHKFWHEKKVLNNFWETVDRKIGELISILEDNTNIIIISDHGFGFKEGNFNMNKWLEDKGYIKRLKKDKHMKKSVVKIDLKKIARTLKVEKLVKKILPKSILGRIPNKEGLVGIAGANIDWENTTAIGSDWSIYIIADYNSKEYKTIKKNIIRDLKGIINPITNKKINPFIYEPKGGKNSPGLIISLEKEGYDIGTTFGHSSIWSLRKDNPRIGSGTHRKEGIFIAKGVVIKENYEIKNAEMTDIMPMILKLFNINSKTNDTKLIKILK